MRTVQLEDVSVYYEPHGSADAEPLVLIGGLTVRAAPSRPTRSYWPGPGRAGRYGGGGPPAAGVSGMRHCGRVLSLAALLAVAALPLSGCALPGTAGRPSGSGSVDPAASVRATAPVQAGNAGAATGAASATPDPSGDPAQFAPQVRRYAGQAGIDPQLLMAILYNESYKPHDPGLERAWQKIDPDAAFGVANMHRAAFDDTKRGRDFADRDWTELPDDPGLAIEAAAWYLHDLADQLPASWPAKYTKDELLALGYNAGSASMKAFARGGKPGSVAQSYLDRLHSNWDAAARALA